MENTPNYKNHITLSSGKVLSGITADLSNENIGVTKSKVDYIITDSTPDSFCFTDIINSQLNSQVESETIIVSGINTISPISIQGGEYSINGGDYTDTTGAVNNGDSIKVKHTTSGLNNSTTNTTLIIGGVSDIFSSTTK